MDIDPQPPEASTMSQQHQRKRAQSRASTASIHSVATQPNHERSLSVAHHGNYHDQWHMNGHASIPHSKDLSVVGHQMGQHMAGEEILHAASQIHLHQSFAMDSGMHQPVGPAVPYHHPGVQAGVSVDSYGTGTSFTDADSQMLIERDDPNESDMVEAPRRTSQKVNSGRTSANNELEMRQLYHSSRHRNLEDVAKELHGNERGPNSERTRQVFAMLWINQVCTKGKASVPRGRVYANYASRCATERITVLNPASFGKLVRVLFPGLKTRRLGVRGESKYHYVNFTLMEDQPELKEPMIQPALPIQEPSQFQQSFSTTQPQPTTFNTRMPALLSPQTNQPSEGPLASTLIGTRAYSLYNQPDVSSIDQLDSSTTKTMLHLAFPKDGDDQFDQAQQLILPRIQPFLPSEQCDFVLYQRMARIIAGLTLQVVPKTVLDTLRNISERLVAHIREAFQGQPRHVVRAKEAAATIFAALLDRALRVNLTAHAAANMLANSANRNSMYMDWITMVRIRKIAECVPTRAMDDLVQVLLNDMRGLLEPTNVPWEIECLTLYGDVAQQNSQNPHTDAANADNPQNMLDRWVQFLCSLPNRFPYSTPADIVWCVQRVGTEVMRDLTIAQGKSFGSWWVTKCWIDEMVAFLAEQGGFMQSRSSTPAADETKRSISVPIDAANASQEARRNNSDNTDLEVSQALNAQAQPDSAPFPSRVDVHDPDDSGIGIRTPEEDFPMAKFEF
ncbi:hypothetical protein E0Z10_g8487 [Xylaria hypoxylon]|uniref:RFX-type winged-helix domain-containing protein n=1 Tax=Xylaria hypoxylon TaxID=37992 RepID=A0A4Z0YRU5_9PEZI|nr:hypothetical protein E0Z10_g8487 [Xylaria hypoxylon]